MRHINYVLKPATIDNAKAKDKRYDLTDAGGLVLEVMPSGSKTWRFKFHLNGKREKVTIGTYATFTIKQARDLHEELRALVERGQSPAKAKRALSTEQKAADARRLSFRTFGPALGRRDAVLSVGRLRGPDRALARCVRLPGP